ncbi:MAG: flagellar hook-basal body complex protein FliE [Pseudomonadota bacterium]|jgi:flagellar hook-basal body complex protein FliE|nr:flagellar hook-basal body complex protein FliE [Pseudomonadota bacterium]
MDVRLKPFDFSQALARNQTLNGTSATNTSNRTDASRDTRREDFSDVFSHALKTVSAAQNEAGRLQREVSLDSSTVSIEETMIAMQRSNIGFQMALQVRNRIVQAYSEVMGMQV